MSIYHTIEQRSAAWFKLRLGRPTASEFHKIVTAGGADGKKAKVSEQAVGYAHRLLAERMLGRTLEEDDYQSQYMIRGQELEDKGIEAYEFTRGVETSPGGFVADDTCSYGCSPDRLIGSAGIMEMKCPAPATHIRYLIDGKAIVAEKRPQVQGQLLVTGREWVDLVSYHPEMPIAVVRAYREDEYIGILERALCTFCEVLMAQRLELERQYGPFPEITEAAALADDDPGALGVSMDDCAAIWEARDGA